MTENKPIYIIIRTTNRGIKEWIEQRLALVDTEHTEVKIIE